MLKTRRGDEIWLISQPAHAELSGQLAAHWGNGEFAPPGRYAEGPDPESLRKEVVLAVAQHDNGWWEWETDPPLSPEDGLPQGLGEVIQDRVAGMERWRLGVPRLAQDHPYASLLIADHAYWLYAAQFEDDPKPEFTHHLQGGRSVYPRGLAEKARQFLDDMQDLQERFRLRIQDDSLWRSALEPDHRYPHARLLQTLDAFSLALCSDIIPAAEGATKGLGRDPIVLNHVPRQNWDDRVSIELCPQEEGTLAIDPYPFDQSPLTVSVPVRVAARQDWWPQVPWTLKNFTLQSP